MRDNSSSSPSPSPVSWYLDLSRDPSHSVGHMLGSSHVEQMYSDLGSDWRKALRKTGEWMTTCWELGWDGIGWGGGASWWWWLPGWDMGRIWIRDLESSRADRLYRCNGPAGVLMCTDRWVIAQMASWKDSPSWNFTCRQPTAVSGLLGPSHTRKQDDQ